MILPLFAGIRLRWKLMVRQPTIAHFIGRWYHSEHSNLARFFLANLWTAEIARSLKRIFGVQTIWRSKDDPFPRPLEHPMAVRPHPLPARKGSPGEPAGLLSGAPLPFDPWPVAEIA